MIEALSGIRETIKYRELSRFRLFQNIENENYPPHWHVGIEIIMPVDNWYKVQVGDDHYHLEEEEILLINSGVIHTLTSPDTGKRIIFQFDLSLLYDLKEFDTTLFMLPPVLKVTSETFPDVYPQVLASMKQIIKEDDSDHALKEAAIYSNLIQLYVPICRKMIYDPAKFGQANMTKRHEYIEKLLQTCEYINRHSTEDLSLQDVAEHAGFSKFHFSRLFKEFTGKTFHDYLIHKRLVRAETLLLDTDLSIMEVALDSGFTSISTFNRIFRQEKKCSPRDFRRQSIYYDNSYEHTSKGGSL